MTKPRAYTAIEARAMLLDAFHSYAAYWAVVPNKTPQEMCDGLAFSLLNLFDGGTTFLPAMRITLAPHPDDKEYNRRSGSNWFEPRTLINRDCALHELYYQPKSTL
jgi:hypothetical protein